MDLLVILVYQSHFIHTAPKVLSYKKHLFSLPTFFCTIFLSNDLNRTQSFGVCVLLLAGGADGVTAGRRGGKRRRHQRSHSGRVCVGQTGQGEDQTHTWKHTGGISKQNEERIKASDNQRAST